MAEGPEGSNKDFSFVSLPARSISAILDALVRRDSLRVHIERDLRTRVPQQFLHHLDILAGGFQQSREGAPKGVPANSLRDLRPRRPWTDGPL
jgi:hypothetical protein